MIWNEIITAIVTSLIASVVFWVVFNVIPSKVERKKIKPLLDFDLYQIYTKLAHFLEMPLKHSNHSPSHLQMRLYHGQLKKEDFEQYLSAKCLTEEYQQIGDREKGLAALRMHLQEDSTRLIYQRGYFEEFIDDNEIKETLIAARSEEEYEEMAICIKDEREQQRLYEEFVRQMHDFYVAKLNTHVRSSVKKQ